VSDQVFHAAVVAGLVEENLFNAGSFVAQARGNGVEAENHFVLGHRSSQNKSGAEAPDGVLIVFS
jgi:hypothetical protein